MDVVDPSASFVPDDVVVENHEFSSASRSVATTRQILSWTCAPFRTIVLRLPEPHRHSVVTSDSSVEAWHAQFRVVDSRHVRLSLKDTTVLQRHPGLLTDAVVGWNNLRRLDVEVSLRTSSGGVELRPSEEQLLVTAFSELFSQNRISMQVVNWNVKGLSIFPPFHALCSSLSRLEIVCHDEFRVPAPSRSSLQPWRLLKSLSIHDTPTFGVSVLVPSLLSVFTLHGTPSLDDLQIYSYGEAAGVPAFLEANRDLTSLGLCFRRMAANEHVPEYPKVEVFRGNAFSAVEILNHPTPNLRLIKYHVPFRYRNLSLQYLMGSDLQKLAEAVRRELAPKLVSVVLFGVKTSELRSRCWNRVELETITTALEDLNVKGIEVTTHDEACLDTVLGEIMSGKVKGLRG